MARKRNERDLDQLCDAIIEHPNRRAGWFARLFGRDDKFVQRQLIQLEDRGDLLEEDDAGRLRFFGRK